MKSLRNIKKKQKIVIETIESSQSFSDLEQEGDNEVNHLDKECKYECPICAIEEGEIYFIKLRNCSHIVCKSCMAHYIYTLMFNNGGTSFDCPCCSESIHEKDIHRSIIEWSKNKYIEDFEKINIFDKYNVAELEKKFENRMLKKVLSQIPGMCWCPGPDCSFGAIAPPKTYCPKVVCPIRTCKTEFCCKCKSKWHPKITCNENRLKITVEYLELKKNELPLINGTADTQERGPEKVKFCPNCFAPIAKISDGGCNHMTCAICSFEFCWICLKSASDSHWGLFGTGCLPYNDEKSSKTRKVLLKTLTLLGTPVLITLFACVAGPVTLATLPSFFSYQMHKHLKKRKSSFLKKFMAVGGTTLLGIVASPLATVLVVLLFSGKIVYDVYISFPINRIKKTIKKMKLKKEGTNDNL